MELASGFNKNISFNVSDVKLAKKGDKEAFVRLIHSNKASLYRIGVTMLKNAHDVEDVFQNTLIKAYKSINTLKNDKYFKTWIIKILINECNTLLSKRDNVLSIDEISTYNEPYVIEGFKNLELTTEIAKLPEDFRVVTLLFYFEDMQQKEIAKILGIAEGTVRSRLFRAREALYNALK